MAKKKSRQVITPRLSLDKKSQGKKTVFVGLSGGVDSAVSVTILKRDFNVVGVFIKVWTPDFLPCTWREDRRDAMRVCAHLDIPFVTLDLEKEYKKEVVDYMIREYKDGRTPNPDIMCNKEIKFGAFYNFAMKHGADFVATGHYARTEMSAGKILYDLSNKDVFHLYEARDKSKDQSYFLWNLNQEQLKHIIFPIGNNLKSDVRKQAMGLGLPNAGKKDSQGLCFLGKVDMKDFLKHFLKPKKGNVLDIKGKKIGIHEGAIFLTVGQRHGFKLENSKNSSKPMYVISKNIKKNTVTVSELKPKDVSLVGRKNCELEETNWLEEPVKNKIYDIRFRYHQSPLKGKVKKFNRAEASTKKRGSKWYIELLKPFAGISPGQSAVVYDKQKLIGGGIIC
jgi:tRNA-specific 2-thiouridylase